MNFYENICYLNKQLKLIQDKKNNFFNDDFFKNFNYLYKYNIYFNDNYNYKLINIFILITNIYKKNKNINNIIELIKLNNYKHTINKINEKIIYYDYEYFKITLGNRNHINKNIIIISININNNLIYDIYIHDYDFDYDVAEKIMIKKTYKDTDTDTDTNKKLKMYNYNYNPSISIDSYNMLNNSNDDRFYKSSIDNHIIDLNIKKKYYSNIYYSKNYIIFIPIFINNKINDICYLEKIIKPCFEDICNDDYLYDINYRYINKKFIILTYITNTIYVKKYFFYDEKKNILIKYYIENMNNKSYNRKFKSIKKNKKNLKLYNKYLYNSFTKYNLKIHFNNYLKIHLNNKIKFLI